jgi:hypothetical protein
LRRFRGGDNNNNNNNNDEYVVGGPKGNCLYTITAVDPLFWILSYFTAAVTTTTNNNNSTEGSITTPKQSWQPLDQMVESFDKLILSCLLSSPDMQQQLQHLLERRNFGFSDNNEDNDIEWYYKFSTEKALEWLTRKQESVQTVLLEQEMAALLVNGSGSNTLTTASTAAESSHGGGAFSAGFVLSTDDTTTTTTTSTSKQQEEQDENNDTTKEQQQERRRQLQQERARTRAREESIQIVCSYLNPTWTSAALAHWKVADGDIDSILHGQQQQRLKRKNENAANNNSNKNGNNNKNKHAKVDDDANASVSSLQESSVSVATGASARDWNASLTRASNPSSSQQKHQKQQQAKSNLSFGAKRLAKTNIKGMKKMSAFFGVAKKTSKTNNKDKEGKE